MVVCSTEMRDTCPSQSAEHVAGHGREAVGVHRHPVESFGVRSACTPRACKRLAAERWCSVALAHSLISDGLAANGPL
jgi:hypothetical protein